MLRITVTAGVALFLASIVLQKTAFDVWAAADASARAKASQQPVDAAESGSVSPPIGPFLGLLLTAGVAWAIHLCSRGPRGSDSSGLLPVFGVIGLGFLGMTIYRLASPHPDSGVVEIGMCGVVWFATAAVATGSLGRLAREVGSSRASSQLREEGEYGILIVLVALLAAVVIAGMTAIAAKNGLTISFGKTPVLAFVRTVAGELLIAVAISAIVWLVAFRRVVQDLVYLAEASPDTPDETPPDDD